VFDGHKLLSFPEMRRFTFKTLNATAYKLSAVRRSMAGVPTGAATMGFTGRYSLVFGLIRFGQHRYLSAK
jgi:hypothetical protein